MKLIPTLTAVLLAGISLRAAESVQVEIAFSERKYVPGENVKAKIVIVNFSARPIHTGEDPRWLTLIVKSESGAEIIERKPFTLREPFTVPQGKQVSIPVDLGEFYAFHQTGVYSIQPVVRWGLGERDYQPGPPKKFDVVQPAAIREQPFGVEVGPRRERRTRVYTVQRLTRPPTHVFTRVSDEESGVILGLVSMGEIVSFAPTVDMQLNRVNYIHVLHQCGAREFRHHVISPEGELIARETYQAEPGRRPFLNENEENRIHVSGGTSKPRPDDIPLLNVPAPRLPGDGPSGQ
ncbi:MAG: hypothetical protein ISQ14_03395 [Verrucomicrobiae bacterium]|nr:hypothetical protein [Verrucomicrobiae bacterium]